MNVALSPVLVLTAAQSDAGSVQAGLQGIYDEISAATLGWDTALDIDDLERALYSRDWVFIDSNKQLHSWQQVRDEGGLPVKAPRLTWIAQTIQKLSLTPDGAAAVVNMCTVRTIVDREGTYGRRGASHSVTETTTFRDRWIAERDGWKMKSREQLGTFIVAVDRRSS
jgi:hypothetical protein